MHWDGDQLLFTTNPYGQVDDIKLGDQADVTPLDPAFTGLTFWDHVDGIQAFCHNSTGNGGLDTNDTRLLTRGQRPLGCLLSGNNQMKVPNSEIFTADYPITSAAQMVGQGAILGMIRSDGIDDGYNVIQGVRSYDPSAGTWTSPDAYAGELHDPMSQKAYMWNRNNPLEYHDPTGYCTTLFLCLAEFSIVAAHFLWGASNAPKAAADFAKSSQNTNEKLRNVATALFRPKDTIPGGTAGAVRQELATGEPVEGRFHLRKGAESLRALESILTGRGGSLTPNERRQAIILYTDLLSAYGAYNPSTFEPSNLPPQLQKEYKNL